MFSLFAPPQRKSYLDSLFSASAKMPRKITPIRIQITTAAWLTVLNVFGLSNSLRLSIVSVCILTVFDQMKIALCRELK